MAYEIPSVHLSVCPEFFYGTADRNFLGFLHEVRASSNLNSDKARFLEKKILVWGYWAKTAQNEVFQVLQKDNEYYFKIFSIFLYDVTANKVLNVT